MSFAYLFKLVIIGDTGVGKSCLLLRFTDQNWRRDHQLTIGVEFAARNIDIAGTMVKLQIWDTAGQEAFRSITSAYYRGATGGLVVYDVTRKHSFANVAVWLDEVRRKTAPDTVLMLVGNKTDLGKREVSYEEGQRFAAWHGLLFQEASAKSGEGVDEVFGLIAKRILDNINTGVFPHEDSTRGIKVGGTHREGATPGCAPPGQQCCL